MIRTDYLEKNYHHVYKTADMMVVFIITSLATGNDAFGIQITSHTQQLAGISNPAVYGAADTINSDRIAVF